MSAREVAERIGVTPATLRRWIRSGLIPQHDGVWTPAAIGQARVVARMRERGHSLAQIRQATEEGRLAFGFLQELIPSDARRHTIAQAAAATGLDEALVARFVAVVGITPEPAGTVSEEELVTLQAAASALDSGFPLVALLQLVRVYSQAMARVADAEVRLFHLYVHEPLMRSGLTGVETAEQMQAISRQVLPLAGPVLDRIHRRYLRYFTEQDVVGHMESDLEGSELDLGRMRVAIAFADLAGYTRLTEEQGDLTAVDAVDRFVTAVTGTLPDTAAVIKTIGDEVMIVGSDAGALAEWGVRFQREQSARPRPRIAVHCGVALYRDGDYYGREVNIASRVAARAAGGEVLVTRPVADAVSPAAGLEFQQVGELILRGMHETTEVLIARARSGR